MADSKRRGRPSTEASQQQVCEALLAAAEECLIDKPFKKITVREIAACAGVNPAMINYYYVNKEGLFIALIDFLFKEWEESLNQLSDDLKTMTESPTRALVNLVDRCFYRHAGVIKLLTEELAEADSSIQQVYRERLASRTVSSSMKFISKAGEYGFYRTDLNPRYAAFSLSSIAMHPISLEPSVLKVAFGIDWEELRSEEWLSEVTSYLDRIFSI